MTPIDRNARIAHNRAAWAELFALADNGDMCGFFDRYVRYLTDCGVYSRERAVLRDACALASVLMRHMKERLDHE